MSKAFPDSVLHACVHSNFDPVTRSYTRPWPEVGTVEVCAGVTVTGAVCGARWVVAEFSPDRGRVHGLRHWRRLYP